MLLTSPAFDDGDTIPLTYAEEAAGGSNIAPTLRWSDAPEGTESFAITVYDPDAPTGSGFWHWIAVDIPASVTEVNEAQELTAPVRQWENDYGYAGYGGPCPPPGRKHRYIFTVHALPTPRLDIDDEATHAQVRATILATQLESASFTGRFQLPGQE